LNILHQFTLRSNQGFSNLGLPLSTEICSNGTPYISSSTEADSVIYGSTLSFNNSGLNARGTSLPIDGNAVGVGIQRQNEAGKN
jgi:hypothetical protein